ncbi:hypothetical protein P3T43_001677 [Paraburkholderia sp. GAS41]|jgi:hypothetical protein|uniref:hypothetical protein n=1 Tax=Paraburkholderia sp. GAS41 TaxID=3035134 RepID=UPI003D247103
MSKHPAEQHPNANKSEAQIDHTVEDSFPASDPPSTGGKTRIESDEPQRGEKPERAKQDKSD